MTTENKWTTTHGWFSPDGRFLALARTNGAGAVAPQMDAISPPRWVAPTPSISARRAEIEERTAGYALPRAWSRGAKPGQKTAEEVAEVEALLERLDIEARRSVL